MSPPDPASDLSAAALAIARGKFGKDLGITAEDVAAGIELARSQLQRSPADALRTYAWLVLLEPTQIDCQVGLANCALQVEQYALALQAASAVISLAPRDPRGYYLSGRACFGLESVAEALEDLGDAVRFAKEAGRADIHEAAQKFAAMIALTREQAPA